MSWQIVGCADQPVPFGYMPLGTVFDSVHRRSLPRSTTVYLKSSKDNYRPSDRLNPVPFPTSSSHDISLDPDFMCYPVTIRWIEDL